MWEVYWYTRTGEECVEEFETQSDADTFIQFNEWEGNEHPRKRKVAESSVASIMAGWKLNIDYK